MVAKTGKLKARQVSNGSRARIRREIRSLALRGFSGRYSNSLYALEKGRATRANCRSFPVMALCRGDLLDVRAQGLQAWIDRLNQSELPAVASVVKDLTRLAVQ